MLMMVECVSEAYAAIDIQIAAAFRMLCVGTPPLPLKLCRCVYKMKARNNDRTISKRKAHFLDFSIYIIISKRPHVALQYLFPRYAASAACKRLTHLPLLYLCHGKYAGIDLLLYIN